MIGTFTTMSKNTVFLLCIILATCINSDAAGEFPYYNGGSHSITNDQATADALFLGDTAINTLLQIQTNAVVEAGTLNMNGNDSTATNRLVLEDTSQLIIGNTTFSTTNPASLIVGSDVDESVDSISMDNAAQVAAENFYMGAALNDSGSVILSGEDTTLSISNTASIGIAGSDNAIDISDGATFKVGGILTLGSATSTNNVISANSGGTLFVDSVTDITVIGFETQTNQVVINNGGTLEVGGDLNTEDLKDRGLILNQDADVAVNGELSANNSAIENIEGVGLNIVLNTSNSLWNVTDAAGASVGFSTSNNSLTLTNGATASVATTLRVGRDTTANKNELNVLGDSLLSVSGTTYVGFSGSDNSLTVNDATFNADTVILGQNANAGGNQFMVETNANVTITNRLIVGRSSINNRYFQTGGTNTVVGAFIIGVTTNATGKTGAVNLEDIPETTGNLANIEAGATLNIGQNLAVGQEGGGSILNIRDGGIVNVAGDTIIGEAVGDNYIYLQRDSNTLFNVTGDLVIGKTDDGSNRFAVYGGTAIIDGDMLLGATTNQHEIKNFIHVETTNAVINVANAIYIGASNSVNTLDLVGGATVIAQDLFVGAYAGVSNNVVTVTGEDSLLSITNNLTLGSDTGTNNTIAVENGGTLFVGGTISEVGGSNNVLNVNNNGTLQTLDWDFTTISSNIFLNTGATLELGGMLSGTNMVEGGIGFTLNGTNALWDTGTNVLYVGNETGNNSLTITNGALATTTTNLYIGYASQDNTITVGGTGSVLNVDQNLFISNVDTNTSGLNNLFVLDGALVSVGNDLKNVHSGILKIDSRSQVTVTGDYEQDEFSTLSVGISSNATPPNLVVDGNAEFAPETTIEVYDDGIGDNTNIVQNIVQAGTLTIDGATASTGLLFDHINIETNLLLDFKVTVSNGTMNSFIVLDNFIKRSIKEAAGLDGMLADVADEIEDIATDGDEFAIEMIKTITGLTGDEANKAMNDYYGEKTSSAPMHNVVNQGIGSIASELTVRGDNTRSRMTTTSAPFGAAGPHTQDQELQGWIAGYGTWGNKGATGGFDGYDANLGGFIIGADLAVSKNILVGLAGGSNSGSVDKDNGANGDTKTTYGAIYASVGTKDWFLDGSMIYGSSSIDNTLGDVFDTTASYDAMNLAFYLGGGKEIVGKYLIVTPQASLLANYYEQDAYDEKASGAVARSVDSFDALYVQSSIGVNLGAYTTMGEVTLKPELRAHWLHEFNGDEENLAYTLIGGTGNYNMLLQAPEEDILKLGAGVSAKMSEHLELRADIDTRLGSDYSDYTLFGSLRYQF